MKMTTRVAFDNMKYHRSKNILIGIAIMLTTFLLFVVPSVGKGMVDVQNAAINKVYPTWHAMYRDVDTDTMRGLVLHHDIERYGFMINVGEMMIEDTTVSLMYLDETAAELYRVLPERGRIPETEEEIVVSQGILEALGQQADIGDTIRVPYQIYRGDGLDYRQEREFRVCGFLADSSLSREQRVYTAFVSKPFADLEIAPEQVKYRILVQVQGKDSVTTTELEKRIQNIAHQFGIDEKTVRINDDYLGANYVDPALVPAIAVIMLIIVAAGIITIYSIYYVSMNQRVQEFGRLKAIGATKRQIRQIVLREGFWVAVIAIPIGLLLGTAAVMAILSNMGSVMQDASDYLTALRELLASGEVKVIYPWAYVLAIVITLCTVSLSLLKPMRTLSGVSEIEAMRYHGTAKKTKTKRGGYTDLTIGRLTLRNLADDKRKSAVTIVSMAITGVLIMVVATVLSCASPKQCADNSILGAYELSPMIEENNKERPERAWGKVQQNNPLNDTLKAQITGLVGVERVEVFSGLRVTADVMGEDTNFLNGVPEAYAKELERGIIKGTATYEELKSGDKVILDSVMQYWYPQLDVGTKVTLTVQDGERTFEKEVEIAAIGNYRSGLSNYMYFYMAKEAVDALSSYNASIYFHVIADENQDAALARELEGIVLSSGALKMRTWQQQYVYWKSNMAVVGGACYVFLGILGAISVMNLVNTMINSVHVRKKELGMMQAIGMSDRQLGNMLQLEGLFYTFGTLAVSVGVGSVLGYFMFLYAKEAKMLEIMNYQYPFTAAVIVSLTLLVLQAVLTVVLAKSVQKDTLIERVRFSE